MSIKIDINVCRVCMKTGDGISIYSDSEIAKKFQFCTQLEALHKKCHANVINLCQWLEQSSVFLIRVNFFTKVSQHDDLPKTLCNKCIGRLKIAYDFRKQAETTHKHLRQVITHFTEQLNQSVQVKQCLDDELDNEIDDMLAESHDYVEEQILPTAKIELDQDDQIGQLHDHDHHQDNESEELPMLNISDEQNTISVEAEGIVYEEIEREVDEGPVYIEVEECGDVTSEAHMEEVEEIEEGDVMDDTEMEDSKALNLFTITEVNYITENECDQTDPGTGNESDSKKDVESLSDLLFSGKSHNCSKCNKDFSTKTNLIRHLQTHDGVKPYECTICGARFTQNGSLKQHLRIHSGERPYKCNVCGRGFTQGKSLSFHMRRHTGEKPYTCETCGLSFRQKDGLKRHVLIKHSDIEVEGQPCPTCGKLLFSKYTLQMHMKKHVGSEPEDTHKCGKCERAFSSKASLINHVRWHTGEKPFKCDTCGKHFSQKGSLVSHLKQHLDVKPYKCETCGKGFTQKHQIVAHLNMHQNQNLKKFKCSKCHKSFTIKRNLIQHLKNHERDDLEDFKCEDCNIGFNSRRGLKLHRSNQHKDDHICEVCNIQFDLVTDLNQHIEVEHDEIDMNCEICDQQFFSHKLLTSHMLEHELGEMS